MTELDHTVALGRPLLREIVDKRVLAVAPTTPLEDVLAKLTQLGEQGLGMNAKSSTSALAGALESAPELPAEFAPEPNFCAIAVDAQGRPVGLITEREVVRWVSRGHSLTGRSLQDVMTPNPACLSSDDESGILGVLERMQRQRLRHLPVVDRAGVLQGVITPETLCWGLRQEITYLESEKRAILEQRTTELEQQVTERTQALQALNQTLESRVIQRTSALQQSLKTLSDIKYALDQTAIIAITDVDGVITDVNDKFCEISEYSRDELIGQTHRLIKSGSHPPEFFAQLWQTIQGGQVWHGEIKNRSKNGRDYWVTTTIVPFFDEQGQIFQYLAIRVDITEQKNAESAIIQRLEKEQELSDLKSRFVTTASHEFRTPLALISSSTGILQDYGDRLAADKKHKHLTRIQGAVQQMTQLIEDVLTFNHAASAQLPFKPIVLDLVAFCTQLWRIFKQRYPERQIIWQLQKPEPQSPTIQADPQLLEKVCTHLLENALKYSPVETLVHWQLTYHAEAVVLQVCDRGIGIPVADQAHLFESFHRAKNVGTIHGTGLGLAIVKNCVDQHQGQITVESVEQVGTTITVELPITVTGESTTPA